MNLRSRLLLTLGVLLFVALVVSGGLVVGITRTSLIDRVDEQLRTARPADIVLPRSGPGRTDPTGRRIALIVLDRDGDVVESLPSGFARNPDPLPALDTPDSPGLPLGQIVNARAVDGSLGYRVLLALRSPVGLHYVLAAPTRQVDETLAVLVPALVVVGGVVLATALGIGWLVIRRDLRPLQRVTATATRISAGDLTQRVGLGDSTSEVGQLGRAFDTMVERIEDAFASQQRALAAKDRSEQQLRQFVADASHELRTPLTTLRGYSDLYRAGGLDDAGALEQAMVRIGTESLRMADLVDDLLLLARLDQGRPLSREPVAVSELVADAVGDARALEPRRPISASIEPGVTVIGDEDRLRQVVGNLLANVRVHTPADSPLEVTLAARDGRCTLVVADHGPGIAPDHASRIFDRFYRADSGRSRDRGGSGLGLAIAAAIVAAHGGTIEHSPTAGGGATFTTALPTA